LSQAQTREAAQYRALVEATSDWLWEVDVNGVYTYVSAKVRDLLGYTPEEVLGKTPFDLMPPDEARRVGEIFAEIVAARRPFERLENVNRHRDGRYVTLETSGVPIFDARGEFAGYRGIDRDVTPRKRQEATERMLASALEQSADLVMIVNRQGLISYVNPAFSAVTGYSAEEAVGRKPSLLKSGMQDGGLYAELWRTVLSGQPYQNVLINRRKDGSLYHEQKTITPLRDPVSGYITHFVSTGKDISEALRLNARLNYLSNHDPLTGLSNRARFADLAGQALVQAGRQRRTCALLYVDFDRFKVVNETLGHAAGDECLKALARRLRERLRAMDCIARLGGDDFAVLLADLPGAEAVLPIVNAVLEMLKTPFALAGRELFMQASIGVSLYPDDGSDVDRLLRHAEAAMYEAKRAGRGSYRFYAGELNVRAGRRLELEQHLHRALEREEFRLHFQPQVGLANGTIFGFEALIRWPHPERGMVSPADFVPLLEETGLIVPVGEWVLREACRNAAAWRAAGLPAVRVAVNLSTIQFHRRDFLSRLSQVIAETGIEPSVLELEVTESVMLEDVAGAVDILRAISYLGVRLGIDDFGTGYSSLAYLKRIPLHTLKLAQPFVHGIPHDPADCGIARSVIAVARSLGLSVVAEGVETEAQLAFLRQEQCDAIQGYLFCRPVPADDVPALLASDKRL
jgi:diguanylate cyclase (GGDEF)-like protein/PAS domain S-box-containing protein